MTPTEFFDNLWQDYVAMAPKAAQIKALFEGRGETVLNDHVAFRTYDQSPINLKALEPFLLDLGYKPFAPYAFEAKKLKAFGYVPPAPELPRVFLSELETAKLSASAQAVIAGLVEQVDAAKISGPEVLWAGRLWEPLAYSTYLELREETEYAAWVAALGLRPNHFTIAVNYLTKTPSIEEVLQVVEADGIPVNTSGGRVKGSPDVLLEQGSTLADQMDVEFAGGERHSIPTCYYEFAKRYANADGSLYDGFVAASADKIFESTDAKQAR